MERFAFFRCGWTTTLVAILLAGSPDRATAITGGGLDGNGHPNVGTFVLTKYDNPDFSIDLPNIAGGATLIHPRVALMAGHGVDLVELEIASGFYELPDLKFSFGGDANDSGTWRDIAALVSHPQYNPTVNNGGGAVPSVDIGALVFKEPMAGIEPATIAGASFLDTLNANGVLRNGAYQAPFTVVGYGHLLGDPVGIIPPFSASTDGLRRVAKSEFMALLSEWIVLDQKFARSNGGTYFGDSGGPVFWLDPNTGEEVLAGVTSRGDARGVASGVYYRVDIPETLDFINNVITRVEAGEFDAANLVPSAATGSVPEPSTIMLGIASAAMFSVSKHRTLKRNTNNHGP